MRPSRLPVEKCPHCGEPASRHTPRVFVNDDDRPLPVGSIVGPSGNVCAIWVSDERLLPAARVRAQVLCVPVVHVPSPMDHGLTV
jgi:hypothetical protein